MATGEKVTITCRTSTDIDDDMNWYQQKPGQAPRLLISEGNTLNSGVPSRFMSSGYGTDFTLKIDGMQSDDAANYFCQQSDNFPLTVIYAFTETCRCCLSHCVSCCWSSSVCKLGSLSCLFPQARAFLLPFSVSLVSTVPYFVLHILHLKETETALYHFSENPVNLMYFREKFLPIATLISPF